MFKKSGEKKLKKAKKIVSRHFEALAQDTIVEPMRGGASNRDYFRVFLPRMPVNNSCVLMLMDRAFRLESFDYYQLSELFRKINLPVPQILQEFSGQGGILLQDVGVSHLNDLVVDSPEDTVMIETLYKQAIDHLLVMQRRAGEYSQGVNAFGRAFDGKKLGWELDFTRKHFIKGFAGYPLKGSDKKTYQKFCSELCAQIAALPRVLCHRDYHSLNLMLWREQLYILDFQDARMGPRLYDMVSLLGDSYVDLGNTMRYSLLRYFAEKHPEYDADDMKRVYEEYTLIALQRHLKHLGTFGMLHKKGFAEAVKHIPLTIGYLRENLSKFEELEKPALLLGKVFDAALERYHSLNLE